MKAKVFGMACAMAILSVSATNFVGCERDSDTVTPDQIQQFYGVVGAYMADVPIPDGMVRGTVVPVTLADGREAQLFVPRHLQTEPHAVYFRDDQGLHPVLVDGSTRNEIRSRPTVVETRPELPHTQKRSWERDAFIIGGSAGTGTAIGAVMGGKKGAAVGTAGGGIGGLIYDLATRDKE